MEFKDYYATLGVTKSATDKEVKQAYRKLARKFHPDVNPGDKASETRFKQVNEAYEVLGDADKRGKYDELGANWRQYEQVDPRGGGQPFGGAGWGPGVRGGRTGGHVLTEEEMRQAFGEGDPFSDFFHAFFGGRPEASPTSPRQGRPAKGRRGRDVEQDLDLTLEQASQGATRRLTIKYGGHARTVDVRIPAGVADGSRVRVAGEGEHGAGSAGDLFLRVRIQPHPRFERKGQDLHITIHVPVTTAVLGGDAEVVALDGHALRLKIPSSTQNGQVFRLKGHGMPTIGKPADRGDIYATVVIRLPRSLTPEQRTLYEQLATLGDSTTTVSADETT
ncbi:MAG: DnaJ C-terminal domain-containing protein [Acidobacteriota bacterium]